MAILQKRVELEHANAEVERSRTAATIEIENLKHQAQAARMERDLTLAKGGRRSRTACRNQVCGRACDTPLAGDCRRAAQAGRTAGDQYRSGTKWDDQRTRGIPGQRDARSRGEC